jgi:hypothetical protein
VNVPDPSPRKTFRLCEYQPVATARSGLPSRLKSEDKIEKVGDPTKTLRAEVNPPAPFPRSTVNP